ncbi:MAG: rhodanese-like domain-containing protein [Chloroflexi bacterium]|nr:rhodanese-like domain-containing protein [Chloroflexota bacterium]
MSKRLFLMLVLALSVLIAACGDSDDDKNEDKNTAATYTTVQVQEAYDRLNGNENALIVDVRQPEEWATTGIPVGAELISLPDVQARAANELPKDKEIFVICNSGNRSREASDILIGLGYEKVVNVDGGIQAWLKAELPVETYTP